MRRIHRNTHQSTVPSTTDFTLIIDNFLRMLKNSKCYLKFLYKLIIISTHSDPYLPINQIEVSVFDVGINPKIGGKTATYKISSHK